MEPAQGIERDLKARLLDLLQTLLPPRDPARAPGTTPTPPPAAPLTYNARGEALFGETTPADRPAPAGHGAHGAGTPARHAEPPPSVLESLRQAVESALARTHVHQLAALPEARQGGDSSPANVWTLELPLRREGGYDGLQLRIEEQPGGSDSVAPADRVWRVLMSLEIDALGPIHALLHLRGVRLAATLWAERESTLVAVRGALDELGATLGAAGAEVTRIECQAGRPADTGAPRFDQLLDVRT